jgi:hypothetical protein
MGGGSFWLYACNNPSDASPNTTIIASYYSTVNPGTIGAASWTQTVPTTQSPYAGSPAAPSSCTSTGTNTWNCF